VGPPATQAFLVNINVLGTYVARDEMPHLGEPVTVRFKTPDTEREVEVEGVVAWLNPRQQHPVHSLPPGFGLSFRNLSTEARAAILALMAAYETGLR
jgi:Tfp pilus assembly protein PilZ